MKRYFSLILATLFCLNFLSGCALAGEAVHHQKESFSIEEAWHSLEVRELVGAVFVIITDRSNCHNASFRGNVTLNTCFEKNMSDLGFAIGRIITTPGIKGDVALVRLTALYISGYMSHEIKEVILERGPKMIPIIEHEIRKGGCGSKFAELCIPNKRRAEKLATLLDGLSDK